VSVPATPTGPQCGRPSLRTPPSPEPQPAGLRGLLYCTVTGRHFPGKLGPIPPICPRCARPRHGPVIAAAAGFCANRRIHERAREAFQVSYEIFQTDKTMGGNLLRLRSAPMNSLWVVLILRFPLRKSSRSPACSGWSRAKTSRS
jgi:hypothetical protein